MDETVRPGADAGPSIVVEITPRDYRWRGWVFLVGGMLLTGVSVWLGTGERSAGNPVVGVFGAGCGVHCLVQARRRVTRNLLTVDRPGIRSSDGLYDQSWDGVVMVWVGSSTGLGPAIAGQPVLSLYTGAGIDFARRAGTRPAPRYSVPVGLPWTVATLCERLQAITDATVVSGRDVSRRAAAAELLRPATPG